MKEGKKMKPINKMKITFDSRSMNEGFARTAIAAFILPLDPTVEEITDLKTAVSEAVTNCIVHGYKDSIGTVTLSARLYPQNKVRITVSDKGCGIPDVNLAMQPLYTTVHNGERSGLGFTVMQSFTDKVKVTSKPSGGTRVFMSKKFS